ncbi:hypothetical protein ACFYNY_34515 [Streptomyces sp. NPDC006530]|uniref:hypothetical protein n=1 Tax=Streptomyces sp. NPDC006530 TaxID=3364750 RepID=UPI0036A68149
MGSDTARAAASRPQLRPDEQPDGAEASQSVGGRDAQWGRAPRSSWDTLKDTGTFPEPDRYVDRRPQWHPDTLAPYIERDRELWPVSRAAEYLGYSGPSATGTTRKQLSRWGLMPEGRGPGRGGESLYAADQIIAAHTHRPGRGARTDLLPSTDDD